MDALILHKKTGFKNLNKNKPIIIRDFRHKLFYSTEGLKPVAKFNLPEGSYFIEKGDFSELKKPLKYPAVKLPAPERSLKPPFDYSIAFSLNPNKCTINWREKTITFDRSLLEKTIPELFFILYHEYGHSLYSTEKYADLMAVNIMYKRGFNPSQIGKAPLTSLSVQQIKRKKNVINKIIGK